MTLFLDEPTYFKWDYRDFAAKFTNAKGDEYVLLATLTYSTSTLSEAITVTATLIDYVGVSPIIILMVTGTDSCVRYSIVSNPNTNNNSVCLENWMRPRIFCIISLARLRQQISVGPTSSEAGFWRVVDNCM
jgi:hypothetical protein